MWSAARVDRNKIGFSGLKVHKKIAFYPNLNFFSPKFIAWNIGSDGKITLSLPVDNSRIHIRGREFRQTGNPSDEFPVLVRIRDENVIWTS